MIRRLIRRGVSYVFLAAAVTGARAHMIFGALIRRVWRWTGLGKRLLDWNMRQWQRGMLYTLKQFGKYQGIDTDDDEGNK